MFEISGLDKDGKGFFVLDSKEYSLFENEKEVLLKDNLSFQIQDISYEMHEELVKDKIIKE
jgi:hypothetical protein